MFNASWTSMKVPVAEPRRVVRSGVAQIRDRITVGVILVVAAAMMILLFFLAGLAGTNYWPMLP